MKKIFLLLLVTSAHSFCMEGPWKRDQSRKRQSSSNYLDTTIAKRMHNQSFFQQIGSIDLKNKKLILPYKPSIMTSQGMNIPLAYQTKTPLLIVTHSVKDNLITLFRCDGTESYLVELPTDDKEVYCSPDGNYLLIKKLKKNNENKEVSEWYVWDLQHTRNLHTKLEDIKSLNLLSFSPDSTYCYLESEEKALLYSFPILTPLPLPLNCTKENAEIEYYNNLTFSNDGKFFVANWCNYLLIGDLEKRNITPVEHPCEEESLAPKKELIGNGDIYSMAISSDNELIACGFDTGQCRLSRRKSPGQGCDLVIPENKTALTSCDQIYFDSTSSYLLSHQKTLDNKKSYALIWSLTTQKKDESITLSHPKPFVIEDVDNLIVSPNLKFFVAQSSDGTLSSYSFDDLLNTELNGSAKKALITSNGNFIVYYDELLLKAYNTNDGTYCYKVHENSIRNIYTYGDLLLVESGETLFTYQLSEFTK